ncbi:mechanosensitive ion channel domain-containing protein [Paludisphaera borealis]|uniref:Miniconductance mechanosensitive channel MscM n=1 Tax=Paludisphaera borealis TaxID=1387353 RepID=A0A1U7CTG6_9BACT|nr:mechanosensitive ion channel domain-containing protein [Paludisphaera borealis]APW62237.1 Miniconductance mechanosensitive channel MscM [Paludisphaera borealis]
MKRALRSLLLGLVWASIWPSYLAVLALAASLGPWPRSTGVLAATILNALALGLLARGVLTWFFKPEGWAERYLEMPPSASRQFRGAGRVLTLAAMAMLVPAYLFLHGEISHDGRALTAPALARFLILGFEILVLASMIYHLRPSSALMLWINPDVPTEPPASADVKAAHPASPVISITRSPLGAVDSAWATWFCRRARTINRLIIAYVAIIILFDYNGYTFAARRLTLGGVESLVVFMIAWGVHRVIGRVIAWRARSGLLTYRIWSWTGAASLLSNRQQRGASGATAPRAGTVDVVADEGEWAVRLARLSTFTILAIGLATLGWIWGIDPTLLKILSERQLWTVSDGSPERMPVVLGDVVKGMTAILAGAALWRYMTTLFSFTLFRKMPDDPGIRFAVVTLCRYVALGVAVIVALESVHLGLAQIGVILAALGVGLGFGLQEIVSNFVCGIILLLERPIRIGDIVTVGETTGKVDRINIRATMIINGDNQCMIVPNREFITGKLVNWTHKDKIMRVSIKLSVAHDSNVDQVVKLLLTIAQSDFDVLSKPASSALLEEIGEMGLKFGLYAFVADPGLVGGTKHRISKAIQERFAQAGIVISSPIREITLAGIPDELTRILDVPRWAQMVGGRVDPGADGSPPPHVVDAPVVADRRVSQN